MSPNSKSMEGDADIACNKSVCVRMLRNTWSPYLILVDFWAQPLHVTNGLWYFRLQAAGVAHLGVLLIHILHLVQSIPDKKTQTWTWAESRPTITQFLPSSSCVFPLQETSACTWPAWFSGYLSAVWTWSRLTSDPSLSGAPCWVRRSSAAASFSSALEVSG